MWAVVPLKRYDRAKQRLASLLSTDERKQLVAAMANDVLTALGGVPQVPIMEDLDLVQAMKRAGRVARLAAPATTSPRRHRADGPLRLALRHVLLALGWRLGIERRRLAAWSRR